MKNRHYIRQEEKRIMIMAWILPICIWMIAPIGARLIIEVREEVRYILRFAGFPQTAYTTYATYTPYITHFFFWITAIVATVLTVIAFKQCRNIIKFNSKEIIEKKEVKQRIMQEIDDIITQGERLKEYHLIEGGRADGERRRNEMTKAIFLLNYFLLIDKENIQVFLVNEMVHIEAIYDETVAKNKNVNNTIAYKITTDHQKYYSEAINTSSSYAVERVDEINSQIEQRKN